MLTRNNESGIPEERTKYEVDFVQLSRHLFRQQN